MDNRFPRQAELITSFPTEVPCPLKKQTGCLNFIQSTGLTLVPDISTLLLSQVNPFFLALSKKIPTHPCLHSLLSLQFLFFPSFSLCYSCPPPTPFMWVCHCCYTSTSFSPSK